MAYAPDYIDRDALAAFLRIEDNVDDQQIGWAITAASRAIDRATRRQFGLMDSAVPAHYTPELDPLESRVVVQIKDLMTVQDLLVHVDVDGDETYSAEIDSFTLRPRNAPIEGEPWTELVVGRAASAGVPLVKDAVRVTARFGWSTIPTAIQQACALQASRILSRRDSPFGVAGTPSEGSELRLLAKVDPDVEVIVGPYRRRRVPVISR